MIKIKSNIAGKKNPGSQLFEACQKCYEIKNYTIAHENRETTVILLLEKLGYPMDRLGTYLQKTIILRVAEYLETGLTVRNESITEEELKMELNNYFSQFYFEIARNELDIGTRTFHAHIKDAVEKIDYSKVDENIIGNLFCSCPKSMDYAEQAFILGSYLAGKLETKKNNSVKTRKLENKKNI